MAQAPQSDGRSRFPGCAAPCLSALKKAPWHTRQRGIVVFVPHVRSAD